KSRVLYDSTKMATISDSFPMSVKRFWQRRRYTRLDEFNGGRKRLRIVKLGGHKGKLVWKLKLVPKLTLKFIKPAVNVSAKSRLSKMRDAYTNMMFNLAQFRIKTPKRMCVEEFNDKMIVEIYKSLGIQVQVLPSETSSRYIYKEPV
ncbi:hypothetical protein KI387_010796, partial [Taxus chinensis]